MRSWCPRCPAAWCSAAVTTSGCCWAPSTAALSNLIWHEVIGDGSTRVAVSDARIAGVTITDAMVLELDDAGLIVRIRPHLRPWLAITLFALLLGPKIARHRGALFALCDADTEPSLQRGAQPVLVPRCRKCLPPRRCTRRAESAAHRPLGRRRRRPRHRRGRSHPRAASATRPSAAGRPWCRGRLPPPIVEGQSGAS